MLIWQVTCINWTQTNAWAYYSNDTKLEDSLLSYGIEYVKENYQSQIIFWLLQGWLKPILKNVIDWTVVFIFTFKTKVDSHNLQTYFKAQTQKYDIKAIGCVVESVSSDVWRALLGLIPSDPRKAMQFQHNDLWVRQRYQDPVAFEWKWVAPKLMRLKGVL